VALRTQFQLAQVAQVGITLQVVVTGVAQAAQIHTSLQSPLQAVVVEVQVPTQVTQVVRAVVAAMTQQVVQEHQYKVTQVVQGTGTQTHTQAVVVVVQVVQGWQVMVLLLVAEVVSEQHLQSQEHQ
jgi:zinc transporter ZupT